MTLSRFLTRALSQFTSGYSSRLNQAQNLDPHVARKLLPIILWQHVLWERQLLNLPGFKSETLARFIPLFAELAALLRKIQERRKSAARFYPEGKAFLEPADPIFRLKECQKTIDAVCKRTGCSGSRTMIFGTFSRPLALRVAWTSRPLSAGRDTTTEASWR